MNKLEVAKLYKTIKKRYSNFDASLQAVEEDLDVLKDIPYEVAVSNFRKHFMTSDFPRKSHRYVEDWESNWNESGCEDRQRS